MLKENKKTGYNLTFGEASVETELRAFYVYHIHITYIL